MNKSETTITPFKINESGYHRSAVKILSEWVGGVTEQPFYVDGKIVFIPDVTVYQDGVIQCIYEVVHKHPLTGKKYGMIQYWCYMNLYELSVFEVSADFILKQTQKPHRIETMECYIVNPLEYEEIQDELFIPIT